MNIGTIQMRLKYINKWCFFWFIPNKHKPHSYSLCLYWLYYWMWKLISCITIHSYSVMTKSVLDQVFLWFSRSYKHTLDIFLLTLFTKPNHKFIIRRYNSNQISSRQHLPLALNWLHFHVDNIIRHRVVRNLIFFWKNLLAGNHILAAMFFLDLRKKRKQKQK